MSSPKKFEGPGFVHGAAVCALPMVFVGTIKGKCEKTRPNQKTVVA
jgi:hypothetical protein